MKKYILLSLVLCCCIQPTFSAGDEPLKQLIAEFLSTDWPTVNTAKEKLENLGVSSIPEVIAIMDDCRVHKLQNTGDLIYPGAERYFGHGQIVDYEIDDICVRAGWLLEELTFNNFGFTGIHLPDQELSDFIEKTFPGYYNANQKQVAELSAASKRKLIRTLSIDKVKEWWKTESKDWNRLDALREALTSNDEKCQVKALFYLRNGKTHCTGLDEKYYKMNLESIIMRLTKSSLNRVSENAKLVMLDSDFDWLILKPVN
jgi:hypothetical protein